jgi:hypothetical protein
MRRRHAATTLEYVMDAHHRLALRASVAGVLAVGTLSAGCGSSSDDTASSETKTVDDAQVEQAIKDDLGTSVAVTSAKCPSDVPVEKGDTFTCTVTLANGATGKATVTQEGLNKYTYELKAGSVQIPGSAADAAVEKSLAAQGIANATVSCPENIIVKVGTTVTCNVTGGSGVASGKVTFTFSDAEGTIDPASVTA